MAEAMKGLKRTHRCTEVSKADCGSTVTVMGWVQKRRNLGSLIFVDLRDRSGLLQIIFDEKDIGDMEVLCEAAADTGLEREDFQQALIDGLYGREEKEMVRHSREDMKVTSVPTIYVNGERVVPKTYTKEEMAGLLRKYVI